MTEPVFIGSHNARQIVACKVEELTLKHHPEVMVRVKQLPMGVLKRLSKPATKDNPEGDKARIELITLSVVNEDGTPAFTSEDAAALADASAPIFNDLMEAIGRANNKTKQQIDEQLDNAEKN
jgi:hypothetical protein